MSDLEVLPECIMHHTLRNWKKRFIKNKDKVLKMFDERFYRMFEFYLKSCEMSFKHGDQGCISASTYQKLNTTPSN